MHPLLSLARGLSMGCYREYQLFHTLLISTECRRVFEFQLLCTFLARILRSATVHCRIPYYGRLGARPVSVNAFSDQVDGRWTVEPSPSYARTKVRPYPYYGTACTPRWQAQRGCGSQTHGFQTHHDALDFLLRVNFAYLVVVITQGCYCD